MDIKIELQFQEFGGYDSMTGAWEIFVLKALPTGERCFITLATIDQSDFGQERCDYSFKSEEAERVARICYEALRRDYGIPENTNAVRT